MRNHNSTDYLIIPVWYASVVDVVAQSFTGHVVREKSVNPGRSSQIRHRNQLIVKVWQKAVHDLGKNDNISGDFCQPGRFVFWDMQPKYMYINIIKMMTRVTHSRNTTCHGHATISLLTCALYVKLVLPKYLTFHSLTGQNTIQHSLPEAAGRGRKYFGSTCIYGLFKNWIYQQHLNR